MSKFALLILCFAGLAIATQAGIIGRDFTEQSKARPLVKGNDVIDEHESLGHVIDRVYTIWHSYKERFNKTFEDVEAETEHLLAFIATLFRIQNHNQLFKAGNVSFSLSLNHLSDLPSEKYHKLNGYRHVSPNLKESGSIFRSPLNLKDIPDSIDWRDHGYVSEVKNQGQCGSCWAFSTTGSLEGQHFRSSGQLVSLSEQQLVDCNAQNAGCDGGSYFLAFQYIRDNAGIDTERSYDYVGVKEPSCLFSSNNVGATDTGFSFIPQGDEQALKIAVATQGPISVAIDASHPSFQSYSSGVYFEPECSTLELDHAVLVVGYGTDPTYGDYWLVKNSWSTEWGDQGYIRMARNRDNHCGIATAAAYPTV